MTILRPRLSWSVACLVAVVLSSWPGDARAGVNSTRSQIIRRQARLLADAAVDPELLAARAEAGRASAKAAAIRANALAKLRRSPEYLALRTRLWLTQQTLDDPTVRYRLSGDEIQARAEASLAIRRQLTALETAALDADADYADARDQANTLLAKAYEMDQAGREKVLADGDLAAAVSRLQPARRNVVARAD